MEVCSFQAPLFAKSAATLLVLAADEHLLGSGSVLGPIDPQVRHPEKGIWFPAHSIREALAETEATKDPFVKMAMADKLNPFLIGAYKASSSVSEQYNTEVAEAWSLPNTAEIISTFTEKYKSHGYPISRSILAKLNVSFTNLPDDVDELVCDLHDKCTDLTIQNECVIILSADSFYFQQGDFRISEAFPAKTPNKKSKAE